MILVRLQRTFAERKIEWVLSAMIAGWGFVLLQPGDTFDRPYFATMRTIASEDAWGMAMFIVGALRLATLYVNGARTETPRLRQCGCVFGMTIWSLIAVGSLCVAWRTPSTFTYSGLFFLELLSFQAAGVDATRALAKAVRDAGC